MKRTPVQSSNLKSVGHEKSSLTLEVEFHNGKVWRYQPVTEYAHQEMIKADSIGKFFNEHIKTNTDISSSEVQE